jgi:hypothetical protein
MSVTLSTYALLDLDEAKAAIGANTATFGDDPTLILYINGITELIENICGENFMERSYDEVFDGDGTNKHRVRHSPVLSGTGKEYTIIACDGGTAIATANILLNAEQGVFYLESDVFDEGFQNCSIHYHAGRTTIPQPVKMAASITLSRIWKLKDKGFENVDSVSVEGQTVNFNTSAVPREALALLSRYRKPRFA